MRRRALAAAAAVAVLLAVLVAGGAGSALAEVVLSEPVAFAADPARDVAALADANRAARGLWSDGHTLWVADDDRARLFAYDLASGEHDSGGNITALHSAGNRSGRGVWSDCSTVWVSDAEDRSVYAYGLADGRHVSGRGFATDEVVSRDPVGLWSDGETMWVSYWKWGALLAYDLDTGARLASSDIDTLAAAGNDGPTGIWSDGTTMWVADWLDDKIYAYTLATGARAADLDFDTLADAGSGSPRGIWSDGTTMWVSDDVDGMVRAFNMPAIDASAGALRSLVLSGVDFGEFDPETVSYTATVDNSVASTTVSASSLLGCSGALVSPADADADTDGHQVDLAVGDNTITVASTVGDTTTTYTVTVTRGPGTSQPDLGDDLGDSEPVRVAFERDEDAEVTLDGENREPRAVWSDGTTVWVSDLSGRLFAYTLDDGARDSARDVTTLRSFLNRHPNGMWSDGTTVWVSDRPDMTIYSYDLADGAYIGETLMSLHADNAHAKGLWSDGTTLWVADWGDDKLYAYELDTGPRHTSERIADKDITLHADNGRAAGIWSNGATVWVLDDADDRIYAYDLATGDRQADLEFDTLIAAGNTDPKGIWSDGETMWVTDKQDDKIYAYNMPADSPDADPENADPEEGEDCEDGEDCEEADPEDCEDGEDCEDADPEDCEDGEVCENVDPEDGEAVEGGGLWLDEENYRPRALWSDGTTLWVADLSGRLFAYALDTGARDWHRDVAALWAAGNRHPNGMWSDGATVWVADNADSYIYAYDLATGRRVPESEFALFAGNAHAKGLWSDGVTAWVADYDDDKLYAYDLATGDRVEGRDFGLAAGNGDPAGVWSDGATVWVADYVAAKIFAYDLASGVRRAGSEFDTLDAANTEPKGLWSDGAVMWVSDRSSSSSREVRRRIYAYPMAATALSPASPSGNGEGNGGDDAEPGEGSAGFALDADNDRPWGMVGDADAGVVWVHDSADGRLYGYRLADGQRVEEKDSTLDRDAALSAGTGRGVCFDGTTLWRHTLAAEPAGSASSGYRSLMAHSGFDTASPPESLARDAASDIDLLDLYFARSLRDKAPGVHGTGVWCDSSLLLTLFSGDDPFFARVDLTRDEASTVVPVDLGGDDRRPVDLWSDADTVWILHEAAGGDDPRISAYGAADGRARPKLDIDLSGLAGRSGATSVWSDSDTMWIAGGEATADAGGRLWSVPMPDPTAGPPVPWSAREDLGNQIWVRFSEPLGGVGEPDNYRVTAIRYSTSPRHATLTPTRVRIDPGAADTLHITLPALANLRAGDDIEVTYLGPPGFRAGLRGTDSGAVAPFVGFEVGKRAKPAYPRLASLRDRITVTWSEFPSYNEFDPHNTYIEYRRRGSSEWTRAIDPVGNADRTRTIDGAEIGGFAESTAYEVRIVARNVTGAAWRHPETTITLPAFPDPPQAPADVAAAPGPGVGQIRLTWSDPPGVDSRDPAQRYRIGYDCLYGGPGHDSGDHTGTRTVPAGTTSFTLADLPPWAQCSLSVAAENYAGTGPVAHAGTHSQRYAPKRRPPIVRVIRTPNDTPERALPQRSTENACLAAGTDFLHNWSAQIGVGRTDFPSELIGYRTGVMGSMTRTSLRLDDISATVDGVFTVPGSGNVVLSLKNVSETLRPDLVAVLRADTVLTLNDIRYPVTDASVRTVTQNETRFTVYTWTGADTTQFVDDNDVRFQLASTLCVRGLDFTFAEGRWTFTAFPTELTCYSPAGLAVPSWRHRQSSTRSLFISNSCGQQVDHFVYEPDTDELRPVTTEDVTTDLLDPRLLPVDFQIREMTQRNDVFESELWFDNFGFFCRDPCPTPPTGMAFINDRLYVAQQEAGTIIILDLVANEGRWRLTSGELPLWPTGLDANRLAPAGLAYDGRHFWILDERNKLVFKRTTTNGTGGRSGFVSSPLDGCHDPWNPPISPTRGCNFESDLERKRAMGVRDLLSAGEPGTTREFSGALWVDTGAKLVYVGIHEQARNSYSDRGFLAAFDSVDGTRMGDYDIPLHRNNQKPAGVWMDDNEMWVVDAGPANPRVYVYQR